MLDYPNIDPIAFSLGPLKIRWYGMAYVFPALLAVYFRRHLWASVYEQLGDSKEVDDIVFTTVTNGFLGVILGGRVGYAIFYNFQGTFSDPLSIFKIWQGGMSFHGGLLGLLLAILFSSKIYKFSSLRFFDDIARLMPLALFFGRLANFINGELYGRVTTHPFGMIFPNGGALPRHPSQLYEAFFEGLVLWIVIWLLYKYTKLFKVSGSVICFALMAYSVFRFFIEYLREPDPQLGFVIGHLTQGQLLSIGVFIFGSIGWSLAIKYAKSS